MQKNTYYVNNICKNEEEFSAALCFATILVQMRNFCRKSDGNELIWPDLLDDCPSETIRFAAIGRTAVQLPP